MPKGDDITEYEQCVRMAGQKGWRVDRRMGHTAFLKGTKVIVVAFDGAGRVTKATVGMRPVLGKRFQKVLLELGK